MDRVTRKPHHFLLLAMLFQLSLGDCTFESSYYADFCWWKYDSQYLHKMCRYDSLAPHVTCRNLRGDFGEVQDYRFKYNVGGLELSNSSINEIKAESLKELTQLMYLRVDHTNISVVQSGAFSDLAKLRNLHMSSNSIKALPNDVFNALTNLQVLDMSHNNIKSITKDSFAKLSEINELHLNNNELSDISFLIGNCERLEYLDLSYNSIEHFPITGCARLNHLRIGNNRMKEFNGDLFNFQLVHLDVSNNSLSFTNEDPFKHLASLKYLNLSQNPLFKSDPIRVDIFKNMKRLSYLGLSATFLKEIPPGIFAPFIDLYELDLSFNNLTYLPKHEGAEKLHLDNNRLTNFEHDGRLSSVSLDNNLWSCATLLSLLKKYKYKINRGHTYNTTNIKGIACRNSIGDSFNAHLSSASMKVLMQEYLAEFVHEQDEIIEQFDRFKHLVRQRNRNIEHFSEEYLKKLRRTLLFRNASLYFIALASLLAIAVGVLLCHRRNRSNSNNLEQRNLSSALEI